MKFLVQHGTQRTEIEADSYSLTGFHWLKADFYKHKGGLFGLFYVRQLVGSIHAERINIIPIK